MNTYVKSILEKVQNGEMSVDDALLELKKEPFEDLGYAKVDLHRRTIQLLPNPSTTTGHLSARHSNVK